MAHELTSERSMFFVGETPWHGLGVQIPDGKISGEEAMKLAACDWEVGTKPLFTAEGERAPAKAIYRVDTGKILGVGGPNYAPLQNRDAFAWFDPFIDSGECSFETGGSLRKDQVVWALARMNREPSVIVPGDEVRKYVLLSNSHDGFRAIRVGFTPIRVVCANTLACAHDSKASRLLRVRHVGDVKKTLEKVQEAMNLANAEFEATAEQFRFLAAHPINGMDLKRYVKQVMSKPNVTKRAADKIAKSDLGILSVANDILTEVETAHPERKERESSVFNAVERLFESGRGTEVSGVKGTYWGAYNALTEYVAHERGRGDASDRLDSAWFGGGAAITKRALDVAIAMAVAA